MLQDNLQNYHNTGEDDSSDIMQGWWHMQTFIAENNYTVTDIRVKGCGQSHLLVGLKETNSEHIPLDDYLVKIVFQSEDLPVCYNYDWVHVTVDESINLVKNKEYAIVLGVPDGVGSFQWRKDNDVIDGYCSHSNGVNTGNRWVIPSQIRTYLFEVYGDIIPEVEPIDETIDDPASGGTDPVPSQQTPGFELLVLLSAIGVAMIILRVKR